jgi:hypothetical protein
LYTDPTVSDFKTYFTRDFPFGTDPNENVLDSDVEKALLKTKVLINPELFCSQDEYTLGFLLYAAHNLVVDLRNSSQGLASAFQWLQTGKSVGSVSESLAIPQRLQENPYLAGLSKTGYGAEYLMMIYPKLTGQVFTVPGRTRP